MAEDLFAVLSRFHHEVALPQIEAMVEGKLRNEISNLRGEFLTHFDSIYLRFDGLESQYQTLATAVARMEARSAPSSDHTGT